MTTVEEQSATEVSDRPLRSPAFGARGRPGRKTLGRRIWQIPLLLAGFTAFCFGLRALAHALKPVPFATQVRDIRALLAQGKNVPAIDQINAIGNYYMQRDQQAQLQWLAGDAFYLAQTKQNTLVPQNYTRALEHYKKAVALGAQPTMLMNERWGLAALALGDWKLGVAKLEAAEAINPEKLLEHAHELVAAYLALGDTVHAQAVLDRVLSSDSKLLSVDDRAWGYCKKIELALQARRGGSGADSLQSALVAARQAVHGIPERDPSGRILLWIGRAEFEEGQLDAARQDLETARARFLVHHLDDGRAAVLLGKVAQAQGRLVDAARLFQEIVMSQAGTSIWAAARFGRAEVIALQGQTTDPMTRDYHYVIKTLMASSPAAGGGTEADGRPELVNLAQVHTSLVGGYDRFAAHDNMQGALLFLDLLGELKEKPTAGVIYAWATARERRAQQIQAAAAQYPSDGPRAIPAEAMALLKLAANGYFDYSHMTTMDDAVSGNTLWKAAQLFDQTGETMQSIAAYQRFTVQRPRDPRTPEGLLSIGQLYQSVGRYDQAIPVYQRNIKQNGKTPAAYASAVNLAKCYMMADAAVPGGDPEQFTKAEASLLSLVQDNSDILPTANEYRVSVFLLGELYYRHGKWADAILRLEEAVERYPDDARIPHALFMLAETYRRSAGDIAADLQKEPAGERKDALTTARQQRLQRAAELFGRVIDRLDPQANAEADPPGAGSAPAILPRLEDQYLRTSYMDRAQCYFSLGDYTAAIKLYDAAAARFAQDLTAIDAYVQIVNAYEALRQGAQAGAAAERARWLLKRIPDTAFGNGGVPLTRAYYEHLLTLAAAR